MIFLQSVNVVLWNLNAKYKKMLLGFPTSQANLMTDLNYGEKIILRPDAERVIEANSM